MSRHLICSSEYPVISSSASTSEGESSVLTNLVFFDDFLGGNISGLKGGKSCKMSSRILVFMKCVMLRVQLLWKYILLSSFLRLRIKWEYFCAFVYTILKKNITPIFDNNCVYCLYIFGKYVYCFCTHRRLKNICTPRNFYINHYKAYFYCLNNEQLVALVNVMNKT